MRLRRYKIVPRDEVVAGLRANVGKLQRRFDNCCEKRVELVAKNGKLRAQIRADQLYIDQLEARLADPAALTEIRQRMKGVRA